MGQKVRGAIIIKNIEFQAYHGATAAERRSLRRFQLDARLVADVTRAVSNDRLADTVNYQELCAIVVEVATRRTYKLLEALGGALVDALSVRWPQADIEIELRKLHPPCLGNPDYAAVCLQRNAPPGKTTRGAEGPGDGVGGIA